MEQKRFDIAMQDFLNRNVRVTCTNGEHKEGVLGSWDFRHQSVILQSPSNKEYSTFVRGSCIVSVELNK